MNEILFYFVHLKKRCWGIHFVPLFLILLPLFSIAYLPVMLLIVLLELNNSNAVEPQSLEL